MSLSSKNIPYMREHSKQIRCLTPSSHLTIEDDAIITNLETMSRAILVMTLRNKQRLLQSAWQRWVGNVDIFHDYKKDVITILSRPLPEDEMRSEFEIEVIFKWVLQNHHIDPTGLAYTLYMCKSKAAIVHCIQQCRLERYAPRCPILLQNDLPKAEEGHFTVLSGRADIMIFPPDSLEVLRLHSSRKNGRGDEEIQKILEEALVIDNVNEGSGFGELSTITKMKRSATVRAWREGAVEVLVIPNFSLLELLEHRRALLKADESHSPSAEVMDYLRQSGLVYKAAMVDVMEAASCMQKVHYQRGSIVFKKGDLVDRLYIVLYGEILLDTKDYEDSLSRDNQPFQHLDADKCHILKSGSILGDEGMVGKFSTFESSAIVLSETATFFEVTGFGISFLSSRLGVEKYSALVYKDQPLETGRLESLNDDLILHSTFNSLRRSIATHCPYRGIALKATRQPLIIKDILVQEKEQEKTDISRIMGESVLLPKSNRPKSPRAKSPKNGGRPRSPGGMRAPGKRGAGGAPPSPTRSVATKSPSKPLPKIGTTSPTKKEFHRAGSNALQRAQVKASRPVSANAQVLQSHHGPAMKAVPILTPAALHHVQSIMKIIKKREAHVMRTTAHENVMSAAKAAVKKKYEDESKEPSREEVMRRHRLKTIEDKFQRALAAYVIRAEDADDDEESKNERVVYYGDKEKPKGLLEVATDSALSEFDDKSVSSSDALTSQIYLDPRYLVQADVPLVDQYIQYLGDKQLGIQSTSSLGSYDIDESLSHLQKRPPSVPPLLRAQSSGTLSSSNAKVPTSRFSRMSTIYTVGVDLSKTTDRDGNPKMALSRQRSLAPPSKGPIRRSPTNVSFAPNVEVSSRETSTAKTSSALTRKKLLDRQRSHPVEVLDQILRGGEGDFTNAELKNIYVPEHLWETRFMKGKDRGPHAKLFRMRSSQEELSKSDLLTKARSNVEKTRHVESKQAETYREKWQRAISTVMAQNAKMKIERVESDGNDGANMYSKWQKQPVGNLKDVFDAKRNILKTYQDAMDRGPASCKYTDGKKKSSKSSRFRLGNVYDRKFLHNDPEVPEHVVVSDDMADLVTWKKYCLESTQHSKNGPIRTLPVLATRGSHSLYWGKQVVASDGQLDESDQSLLLHSLKKMSQQNK